MIHSKNQHKIKYVKKDNKLLKINILWENLSHKVLILIKPIIINENYKNVKKISPSFSNNNNFSNIKSNKKNKNNSIITKTTNNSINNQLQISPKPSNKNSVQKTPTVFSISNSKSTKPSSRTPKLPYNNKCVRTTSIIKNF